MISAINSFFSAMSTATKQGPQAESADPKITAPAPVDHRAAGELLVKLPKSLLGQNS